MDFLNLLQLPFSTAIYYVIPFLLALVVIIFIHEYGHFQVARWCGVDVEVFSIGFGKEITGWHDRHGTRWKLCWIPLGGYVKFRGDANAASMPDADVMALAKSEPGNFHGKPVWQRAAVVVAGPVANFILAIFIFSVAFMTVGAPVTEPRVDEVLPGSAAEQAGIRAGDLIVSIEGREIESFTEIQRLVVLRAGEELKVVIERNGERLDLAITPKIKEEPDGFGGTLRKGQLGVQHNREGAIRYERMGPLQAIETGAELTWFVVDATLRYLGKLFTGHESPDQIGGPISMAKAAGDAASIGFIDFVILIASLSASIGLVNLFPIPLLDGGHLVYYALEAVRGKPLGKRAQEWGFRVGFSVVIFLMVFGTWNDLTRVATVWFGG